MMLNKLQEYMKQVPVGQILETSALEEVLAACWDELKQHDAGMESYKLRNRMESVFWNPPLLRFSIERHGGTVLGSVYAEMQDWTVDVDRGEASVELGKRRQVKAKSKPLNVEPIADDLIRMINERQNDPRLEWHGDSRVKIVIGAVIPATNQQTTSSRRKKLWRALEQKVHSHGWKRQSNRSQFLQRINS